MIQSSSPRLTRYRRLRNLNCTPFTLRFFVLILMYSLVLSQGTHAFLKIDRLSKVSHLCAYLLFRDQGVHGTNGAYRLEYSDNKHFARIAKKLEIMEDTKSGVPRTAYLGVVQVRLIMCAFPNTTD